MFTNLSILLARSLSPVVTQTPLGEGWIVEGRRLAAPINPSPFADCGDYALCFSEIDLAWVKSSR